MQRGNRPTDVSGEQQSREVGVFHSARRNKHLHIFNFIFQRCLLQRLNTGWKRVLKCQAGRAVVLWKRLSKFRDKKVRRILASGFKQMVLSNMKKGADLSTFPAPSIEQIPIAPTKGVKGELCQLSIKFLASELFHSKQSCTFRSLICLGKSWNARKPNKQVMNDPQSGGTGIGREAITAPFEIRPKSKVEGEESLQTPMLEGIMTEVWRNQTIILDKAQGNLSQKKGTVAQDKCKTLLLSVTLKAQVRYRLYQQRAFDKLLTLWALPVSELTEYVKYWQILSEEQAYLEEELAASKKREYVKELKDYYDSGRKEYSSSQSFKKGNMAERSQSSMGFLEHVPLSFAGEVPAGQLKAEELEVENMGLRDEIVENEKRIAHLKSLISAK